MINILLLYYYYVFVASNRTHEIILVRGSDFHICLQSAIFYHTVIIIYYTIIGYCNDSVTLSGVNCNGSVTLFTGACHTHFLL